MKTRIYKPVSRLFFMNQTLEMLSGIVVSLPCTPVILLSKNMAATHCTYRSLLIKKLTGWRIVVDTPPRVALSQSLRGGVVTDSRNHRTFTSCSRQPQESKYGR